MTSAPRSSRSLLRRTALLVTLALAALVADSSQRAGAAVAASAGTTATVATDAPVDTLSAPLAASLFRTAFGAGMSIEPVSIASGSLTGVALATGRAGTGTVLEQVPVVDLGARVLDDHGARVDVQGGVVTTVTTARAVRAVALDGSSVYATVQTLDLTAPGPGGTSVSGRTMVVTGRYGSATDAVAALQGAGGSAGSDRARSASIKDKLDKCRKDRADCYATSLAAYGVAVAAATAAALARYAICYATAVLPPALAACIAGVTSAYIGQMAAAAVALALAMALCDHRFDLCWDKVVRDVTGVSAGS